MQKNKGQNPRLIPNFANLLLTWFDQFGRKNLPWQIAITPYRVWISEIMLQQTQVATVIPYFIKFLEKFPDITSLAHASLDEVLHLWTGLGYYARARNLHKTAKIICQDYQSLFPQELAVLIKLPGIGQSTAGAILSIAFRQPTPILDGNVKRVLCRYHAISGYPSEKKIEQILWTYATEHTPSDRCADYTQAIMDLGATLCTRSQPNCLACPLKSQCLAYISNKTADFPTHKKKNSIPTKSTRFLIFCNDENEILLEKRSAFGIWGGLWSFPECSSEEQRFENFEKQYGFKVKTWSKGTPFRHTFSHFHLEVTPIYIKVKIRRSLVMDPGTMQWYCPTKLPKIGLAAPVKKLLGLLLQTKAEKTQ